MAGDGRRWSRGAYALLLAAAVALAPGQLHGQARKGLRARLQRGRAAATLPPVVLRALAASDSLRYTGHRIVTVLKDGQPDRHEEIVLRDGPRTRIEFPTGGRYGGQVIVENATERRHYIPSANQIRVMPPRRDEVVQRLRQLVRNGRVTVGPGERVAGLPTRTVEVRDASGNVMQRLAIEPESGMVLRRQVFDATGVVVGGFEFTKIDLNPAPFDAALFRIDRKGADTLTPWDTLGRLAKRLDLPAVGLPAATGFQLDVARTQRLPGGPVLVQNYIGPGGRLSLYLLRRAVDPTELRRRGGSRLHAATWSTGGVTYVLLGPQNDATLARLRTAVGPGP